MRIRKNAKLSPLLFSTQGASSFPVETFQTHVCQLNQSPWDVIPFDSDSLQFEGEDSFTGNGSAGDSIGAVESVASMMDAEEKSLPKIEDMVVDDNHGDNNGKGRARMHKENGSREEQKRIVLDQKEGKISCCQNRDDKGWPCKTKVKEGQLFCEHHLSLLKSYNSASYNDPSSKKAVAVAAAAAAAGVRRARARAAKKTSSSSNPYEFYYYSGFGPLWGKRRGDRNGEGNRNGGGIENSNLPEESPAALENVTPSDAAVPGVPYSSQTDNEEFDFADDDEEEDPNGDNGKKRMRKPVKARSLKSLM